MTTFVVTRRTTGLLNTVLLACIAPDFAQSRCAMAPVAVLGPGASAAITTGQHPSSCHCLSRSVPTAQHNRSAQFSALLPTKRQKRRSITTTAQQPRVPQHHTALHVPESKVQAAEHRRQVLSKLAVAGIVYVQVVMVAGNATLFSLYVCRDCHAASPFSQGAELSVRNSDVMQPFRQDSNFAYLTGVHLPGYACLINTATGHFTLLAPAPDPQMVVWMGAQPDFDALAEQYGADTCVDINSLPRLTEAYVDDIICLEETKASLEQRLHGQSSCTSTSSNQTSDRDMQKALQHALNASRAIKTQADIACLQHASDVSTRAHLAMWR